ncbi:MAG: FtsX-like permease family protein, partial [Oscillospiraceae bacterium]|nr:FtsX-like permease family protein [Oscillospiraceae bacterium]
YENGVVDDLGNVQSEEMNKTYFFKDIYDASYNGHYLDTINLSNYFPEGIRVVGISEQDIPVILFEQMKFDQVYSDYVRSYIFDHCTISLRDVSTQEFIQFARENELFLDEPSVSKIYAFLDVINTFILAVIFVLVVLVIISLLMVTTSIGASIKHNSKVIGIIRSLGVTGKDTVKIYVVEAFLLWLGSSAAAILLVGVVLAVTNALFRKTLPEKPFDILYWNVPVVALCIFAGLILILIASVIPIRSFARKKPVEVIREL